MTREDKQLQVKEKQPVEARHGEPTREGLMYVPQVDILENSDAITLRADLPGVAKENVSVDLADGVLTLTATAGNVDSRWRPVYREYEVGGYSRRFTMGERLAQDGITATMRDGVLTVVIPKQEQYKPRTIEVRG